MAGEMQFWGVEVKAKQPLKVSIEAASLIHISQATLGEVKKDNETVVVHVKVGDKKLVLAMLSQKNPQVFFDLVFDEDFEISHNWKNGSIHLMGYQNEGLDDFDEEIDSDEEDVDVPIAEKGQLAALAAKVKAAGNKPTPEVKDDSDEDDSSDDDFNDSDSDDVETTEDGMSVSEDDEDDSDDSEEDSEEETPAKVVDSGKKRPNAETKTPPQSKKAKVATPQKTDGKKGGKTTTPLPSKKAGKSPGSEKSPKSGGSDISCGPCKKTFKTEFALESHTKAKHSAAK